MKKRFFTIIILLATLAVRAQINVDPAAEKIPASIPQQFMPQQMNGNGLYCPTMDLLLNYYMSNFTELDFYATNIFPDSTVQVIHQTGATQYNWLIAAGAVIDPYSPFYASPLPVNSAHLLDSLYFTGIYTNVDGNFNDTLIIEIIVDTAFTAPAFDTAYMNTNPPKWFSAPTFSTSTALTGRKAVLSDPSKTEIKHLLTVQDSSMTNTPGIFAIDLPDIVLPAGNVTGISISFSPGYTYSFGDTIINHVPADPVSHMNNLRMGFFHTKNNITHPWYFVDPYNSSLHCNSSYMILKEGRYSAYGSGHLLNNIMYPTTDMGLLIGAKFKAAPDVVSKPHSAFCTGDTFFFNDKALIKPGVYYDTLMTVSGLDSIIELTLTENPRYLTADTITINPGDSISWNGSWYSAAGLYYDSSQTIHGCDSINLLKLQHGQAYIFADADTICFGDSLKWQKQWHKKAGTFIEKYQAQANTDSIYILNLTVIPPLPKHGISFSPANGLLQTGMAGRIDIDSSTSGIAYYATTSEIMAGNTVAGNGNPLTISSNLQPGTYEIWSERSSGCRTKQGTATFIRDNGTIKLVGSVTYGPNQLSFAEHSAEITLYKAVVTSTGDTVAVKESGPKKLVNGFVEFENLSPGGYFLKSELTDTATYPQVIPAYFYDGPVADSASYIRVNSSDIAHVTVNHRLYTKPGGSNVATGFLTNLANTPVENQVVVLKKRNATGIHAAVLTDYAGVFRLNDVPDNSEMEIFFSSFEYSKWHPAVINTSSNQYYIIDFIAAGDSVYPAGANGIQQEPDTKLTFSIYPNPASEMVVVEELPDNCILSIFDNAGRLVFNKKSSKQLHIDVSALAEGLYILTISSGNNTGVKKLFIKR